MQVAVIGIKKNIGPELAERSRKNIGNVTRADKPSPQRAVFLEGLGLKTFSKALHRRISHAHI